MKEIKFVCCQLKEGDKVRVRYRRSSDAHRLDGKEVLVYEHQVTGVPMPGKHVLAVALPSELAVVKFAGAMDKLATIWGDEWVMEDE